MNCETLEEMDIENRELFTEAGGERYNFIPCLNDTTDFVNALNRGVSLGKMKT